MIINWTKQIIFPFLLIFTFPVISLFASEGLDEGENQKQLNYGSDRGWLIKTRYEGFNEFKITGIKILEGPVSWEDLKVVLECRHLESLSADIHSPSLANLKKAEKLKHLHLFGSELTAEGVKSLGEIESLTRLEIADIKLMEGVLPQLKTLEKIKSLGIDPEYLLGEKAHYVLGMPGLESIILNKGILLDYEIEKRAKLAEAIKGFRIINFMGDEINLQKLSAIRKYPFQVNSFTLKQIYTGYYGIRIYAWAMLFIVILSIYILFKRKSGGFFYSRFFGWVKKRRRRLALFGLVLNFVFFMFMIVFLSFKPKYPRFATGDKFWNVQNRADREVKENRYFSPTDTLVVTEEGYHFFLDSIDSGHPWRGVTLFAVPESDIADLFRLHIQEKIKKHPEWFSELQLKCLLGRKIKDREKAINDLENWLIVLSRDVGKLRKYLQATEWKRLSRVVPVTLTQELSRRLQIERMLTDWEKRRDTYWLTIIFEIIFCSILILLFWGPWVSSRPGRWLPICWAILPLFLILPYQLGYCWLLLSPFQARLQGIFYPYLMGLYEPILCIRIPFSFDYHGAFLEFLNQPVMSPGFWLQSGTSLIMTFIISVATFFICWVLFKKAAAYLQE